MRAALVPRPIGGTVHETTVTIDAMGLPQSIEVTGPDDDRVAEFARALVSAWSRCEPSAPDPAAPVHADDTVPTPIRVDLDRMEARAALAGVSTVVTTRSIDERAGDHLLLHAAACADEASGFAACLVGPSGRGKTTASIALGREFGYLTDEATAVDAEGVVVPYPKPLSIRLDGAAVKEQRSPDALGLRRPTTRAWPLGALFLLDRRSACDADAAMPTDQTQAEQTPPDRTPTTEPVSLPDAIIALAPELSSLHRLDRPLQRLASLVDRTGPVRRLRYAEASTLAPVVRAALAKRAANPATTTTRVEWEPMDVAAPSGTAVPSSGAYRRTVVRDAIQAAETLVVMRQGTVTAAGGLAPAIWRHTREWITTPTLHAALTADLGRPRDATSAERALQAALAAMCTAGLLERIEP